jgi:hypothetical protein
MTSFAHMVAWPAIISGVTTGFSMSKRIAISASQDLIMLSSVCASRASRT